MVRAGLWPFLNSCCPTCRLLRKAPFASCSVRPNATGNIKIRYRHYARALNSKNSISQSINVYLMSWGPAGGQQTKVQFSEFIQIKSLSYMQNSLSGNHHMHWVHIKTRSLQRATILEKVQMHDSNMIVRWTITNKVLLVLQTSRRIANQATPIHINTFNPSICVCFKTMTTCSESAD